MRLLFRVVRGILLTLLLLVLCLAAAPAAIYVYGLTHIPDDPVPADPVAYPEVARSLLWAKLGGHGPEPLIARLSPYGYAAAFGSSGFMVAYTAGRYLLWEESPRERRPSGSFAATVWVSRHWTAAQAVATVLERSYYGHDFVGLRAAARGYFGEEPGALDAEQLAMLVAATEFPTARNPWCHASENFTAARHLLQRARIEVDLMLPDPLPAPDGACP